MANMNISYCDEAYESFQQAVDAMKGYGVTITVDGEEFNAVLVGADRRPENNDGASIAFIPVGLTEEYEISAWPASAIRYAVVDKIEVS